MRRLNSALLMLSVPALIACGKGPETPPPGPTAPKSDEGPSPQGAASPADGASTTPAAGADASAPPVETLVFAKIGERQITDQDITPRLEALQKGGQALDGAMVQETVEDVVDDALLTAEAKAAGFAAPPEADSEEAIAEAWARHKLQPEAEASVSDADVAAWFAERRGMARAVFTDEAAAGAFKAELDPRLAAPEANKLAVFAEAKKKLGKRDEVIPDGVLVDAQGKSELGEALLPEEGAKVLFALAADGDVSAPTKVGDMWLVIQRVGVRPGTPLDKVPEDQRTAAREKLVAHRALARLDEHVARLRKDQGVEIDVAAVKKLATRLGINRLGKLKKLPFNARKLQLQRGRTMPQRAPGMAPAGRDIERLMQERAKVKSGGDQGTPGGTP